MRGGLQDAAQDLADSQHPGEDRAPAGAQHQPHDHRVAALVADYICDR